MSRRSFVVIGAVGSILGLPGLARHQETSSPYRRPS
jgi:hypothetical protein